MTRPAHQAEGFCTLLEAAGFDPVRCPTVEITAVLQPSVAQSQLQRLQSADIVIFTSANAVRYAEQLCPLSQSIPAQTPVLAVGPSTATALEHCGIKAILPEKDFSSQGLLALAELQQVAEKSVLLVRGVGGLPTLPDTLQAKGATMHFAEVYRRQIPDNASILKQLFHTGLPQIISTTSNESLSNLVTLVPQKERSHWWPIPVIVNSARGEDLARSLGFSDDILRANPVGDHGQISTLKAWITQRLT